LNPSSPRDHSSPFSPRALNNFVLLTLDKENRDLWRTCVDLHGMLHHEGVPVEAMKALPLFRLQGIQGTAA